MSEPLQGTASAANAIARVRYTHDAMIDLIIANPGISQNAIASYFGFSVPWVSRVFNSDAFQARLAVRKEDLVDPGLMVTIEERLRALATKSLDVLQEKLEQTPNVEMAFRAAELSVKALGFGARQQNVTLQQSFVVAMPQKAATESDWESKYRSPPPGSLPQLPVSDAEPLELGPRGVEVELPAS